ncbi:N-acetylmuramoyl-L-alanine amidase [Domibacillus aminovorans]|uniref:N-acetylmuramoyl-L-alanine amidase n=1 Tax=Domibacillus aminovorans TaxID=29332 RepID=UPI003D1DDC8C
MNKEIIVVIDFGHGLPDPGAVKYGQEYQYAASIGREIAKRLPDNVKVIFTRTSDKALNEDKGLDLAARCAISNKSGAKLFVSIHLNAGGGTGYETLVYSPNKEANIVHAEIKKVLDKYGVKDRGIKNRSDLAVLKGTKATALLLEMAFIDNKNDMDLLNNQTYFNALCQATADGICKAVGVTPKSVTGSSTVATGSDQVKEEEPKVEYKKDAAPSPRFEEAQKWAKENGISDGTYPQRLVTREEVWSMLHRMSKVK